MRKYIHWGNRYQKEFEEVFTGFHGSHAAWRVWCDFVTIAAVAIANTCEPNEEIFNRREEMYQRIISQYGAQDIEKFVELFGITSVALMNQPEQDFLGSLYMGLDFGNSWTGQFFTPWNVAYMMAMITVGDFDEKIQENGYISVNDPACGAGCMLIAGAAAYQSTHKDRDFRNEILFVGRDLDMIVAMMCYIQLSILGCAGYVIVGNTLTDPPTGHVLLPANQENLWFTPMWYSPQWTQRRWMTAFGQKLANTIV